jgi:hypothetical protein
MDLEHHSKQKIKKCDIYFYKCLSQPEYGLMIKSDNLHYTAMLRVENSESGIGGRLNEEQIKNLRDFLNIILEK